MKNVYLFQPQYKMVFNGKPQYYIPYSIGCLWSYVIQNDWVKENFDLKELFFSREKPSVVLNKITNPVVCGFSCYVWNEQYCLTIAKAIKELWPNCVIVFGGPQVHTDTLKHDFIDTIILGEGENAWTTILESILNSIPVNQIFANQRMTDLNIPSPYTLGIFDDIIKNNPEAMWHMTIETNRGCPFACTFCDWGSLTYSKIKKFDLERVDADLKWAANNPVTYLFCADANFGIFKERDLEIAKLISKYLLDSQVEQVNLQYAKNSNETIMEIAKILGRLNRGVTLSVQSMSDTTLSAIKRKNLAINDFKDVLTLANDVGVKTYSELILGLPEETLTSWRHGITELLELGQHQSIEVWFCQLLKNSEMASAETRKKYGIKSIVVQDYYALYNDPDDGIKEFIELVNGTATMNTEELVDCYMYAWMIIHFHIVGYTQLLAKAARNNSISYRKFYDCLYEKIIADDDLYKHYNDLKLAIKNYLLTGKSFFKSGHAIHIYSYDFMYANKEIAFDLGYQTYVELTNVPDSAVLDLQKVFIYDPEINYPITIKIGDKICQVDSEFDKTLDLYASRRKGLLKNVIK